MKKRYTTPCNGSIVVAAALGTTAVFEAHLPAGRWLQRTGTIQYLPCAGNTTVTTLSAMRSFEHAPTPSPGVHGREPARLMRAYA